METREAPVNPIPRPSKQEPRRRSVKKRLIETGAVAASGALAILGFQELVRGGTRVNYACDVAAVRAVDPNLQNAPEAHKLIVDKLYPGGVNPSIPLEIEAIRKNLQESDIGLPISEDEAGRIVEVDIGQPAKISKIDELYALVTIDDKKPIGNAYIIDYGPQKKLKAVQPSAHNPHSVKLVQACPLPGGKKFVNAGYVNSGFYKVGTRARR